MSIILMMFMTMVVCLVYASIFEWVLHLHVMHAPLGNFRYPYEAHALTHHRIFKADDSYHLVRAEDKRKIRMAWWNGPVLVFVGSIPFAIGTSAFWLCEWRSEAMTICFTGLVGFAGYYAAYEYLHWCMHLPKRRRLESSWLFIRLNGHHVLHHRYWKRNLNVVLPLADLLFGTLLLRSSMRFAQVRGLSVPDVQPL